MMSENKQLLDKHLGNVDAIAGQTDAHPVGTGMGNGLAKAAIGGVMGAVVGTVAAALANKKTTDSINRTVKGAVEAVKGVASGFNGTVKRAGDAVKDTAEDVNGTVKGTVDRVKNTVEDVNDTVKGTVDVKDTVENAKPSASQGVKQSDNQIFKLYEERLVADKKQVKTGEVVIGKHVARQTAHISVPVEKERVVVEQTPVDAETPAAIGEADFYEGEVLRMEIYEETADIHKQAFVRQEISVRKEVEHNTVEVEDKIRREELDIDTQDSNVIDKTDAVRP